MSRSLVSHVALLLATAALFALMQELPLMIRMGGSLAILQLLAFPLVAFLVWRIARMLDGVATWPLVLAAMLACGGAFATYRGPAESGQEFLVARLEGDDLEADTRIFREELNAVARTLGPVRGVRYHASFSRDREVRALFREDPELRAVVWGSSRWMNVSFPFQESVMLRSLDGFPYDERIADLRFITSVPIMGLSYRPTSETIFFLGTLLDGLLPARGWRGIIAGGWDHTDELSLLTAANFNAFWTSSAHHALPWWELGNRYFFKALSREGYEAGSMECARRAYRQARGVLRAGDNADLLAAIYNNAAVLEGVRAFAEDRKPRLKPVLRGLRKGVKARHERNNFNVPLVSWRVARENLRGLRQKMRLKKGLRNIARDESKAKKKRAVSKQRGPKDPTPTKRAVRSAEST